MSKQSYQDRGIARLTLDMTTEEHRMLKVAAARKRIPIRSLIMQCLEKQGLLPAVEVD